MPVPCACLIGFLIAALVGPAAAGPMATIQTDLGDYASAQAASAAEAEIDWADGDTTEDARCTLAFAAIELQHHLGGIFAQTGSAEAQFPIRDIGEAVEGNRIVLACPQTRLPLRVPGEVGLKAASLGDLAPQSFSIRTRGSTLLIYGGDRTGALYGAYELLEQLGVRWFGPEPHNTHIPRRIWPGLPQLDVRQEPAFLTRGFWAWEDRGNPEFFDWMARNRMNFWTVAEDDHPALKKRGLLLTCGGHLHQSLFISPRNPYPYDYADFGGDEGKPTDPYPHGEYRGDADADGVLSYSEAHAEWYGLRGGERSFNITGDAGDNYCTSNADATAELVKNIVAELSGGKWRDADSINFWMLDGGKWCECEQCKALGTPCDRNLHVVHALRSEIERALADGRLHRNVRVFFPVYAETVAPPTRPLPAGFDYDNCIGTFFPIGRCYVHTLDDRTCTEYNARYAEMLPGWTTDEQRFYRGQVCIGEYYNISGFKCLPINFSHTMPHDVRAYHALGARHMHYMHCTTRKWGTKALTNWLLARLLWNPQQDDAVLLADYFSGRYGDSAGQMGAVYEHLHVGLSNATALKYGLARRLSSDSERLFANSHMQHETIYPEANDGPDFPEALAAINAAEAELGRLLADAEPGSVVATRLKEDLAPVEYACALLHLYDRLIQTILSSRAGDAAAAAKHFEQASTWQQSLLQMVEPVSYSSSHASSANGFTASYADQAWDRLLLEYGLRRPTPIAYDPDAGPLEVTGKQFAGGGALKYGYTLHAGKAVTEHGNYVYAANNNPYDRLIAVLELAQPAAADLRLTVTGTVAPRGGQPVPMCITWNDQTVFEGAAPFEEGTFLEYVFSVPRDAVIAGTNTLTIRNAEPKGSTGQRPWFGITGVVLQQVEQ